MLFLNAASGNPKAARIFFSGLRKLILSFFQYICRRSRVVGHLWLTEKGLLSGGSIIWSLNTGPAFLSAATGEGQGELPNLMNLWATFPTAWGGKEVGILYFSEPPKAGQWQGQLSQNHGLMLTYPHPGHQSQLHGGAGPVIQRPLTSMLYFLCTYIIFTL